MRDTETNKDENKNQFKITPEEQAFLERERARKAQESQDAARLNHLMQISTSQWTADDQKFAEGQLPRLMKLATQPVMFGPDELFRNG